MDGWCAYCGDVRTYAWCSFPIDDDQWHPDVAYTVDHDDDILPAFVNWLLYFNRDRLHIPEKKERKTKNKTKKGKKSMMFEEEAEDGEDEEEEEEEWEEEEEEEEEGFAQKDLIEEMEEEELNGRVGKRCQTIVYAHCGSRYDHVIVFSEILEKKGLILSNPIRRGNKLMR